MSPLLRAGPWILLVLLATLPAWADGYTLRLTMEIMIYAILAMSLNLLLGQTGLPSLGHAAFYGAGAYAAGYAAKHLSPQLLLTLPAAVLVAAVVALLVGVLSVRTAGIYFLMLTLAFGQMIKAIAYRWVPVTGGPDGLAGIPRPQIFPGAALQDPRWLFYLMLAAFAGVFWFLSRLGAAPLGRSLLGIRENERRMRALGYDTFRFKLAAFTLAGAIAGLAGALHAHLDGFASTGDLDWSASAVVLVMVVIGGAGNLAGSVAGAAVFVLVQNRLSSLTPYWHLYLGALFIAYVLLRGRWSFGDFRLRNRTERSAHELRRAAGAVGHQPENSGG